MRTPTMRNLEIRRNPERLYMMLLHAPEGICLIDRRHVVEFANPAWARMHGYDSAGELIGRPLQIFHTDEQMKRQVYPFLEMIELIGCYDKSLDRCRPDQSEFSTETTGFLALDEDGAVIGYLLYAARIPRKQRSGGVEDETATQTMEPCV